MDVSEIIDRHRSECEFVRELINQALECRDSNLKKSLELMEFAKLAGEAMTIVQDGERKSYAINDSTIDLVERALFVKAKRMSQCK